MGMGGAGGGSSGGGAMMGMLGGMMGGGGGGGDAFAEYLTRLAMTDPQTAALFKAFLGGSGGGGSGMDMDLLKKMMGGKGGVSDSSAAGLSGEGALWGSNLGTVGGAAGAGAVPMI